MTTFQKSVGLVIAGIVVGLLFSAVVSKLSPTKLGGVYHQTVEEFYAGLKAGTSNQFVVSEAGAITAVGAVTSTGNLTVTTTGTTTAKFLSTSTTKGYCQQFHATSSATLLNQTYAASSTASTVGVIPVIRYGACN